ncbi:aspartyl-tRNA synthetase [Nematocida sp. LUAm3]|nr:aspartyl-tRNA synthetase [Nematocida sp. LUAm3]KAI5175301.1 aspartyl-tRNA synthetase [Nematocida sp. LUAm2]KAI5177742.1 aspartyl-tRNA synthetase [Nematocida sp. LUAm1]
MKIEKTMTQETVEKTQKTIQRNIENSLQVEEEVEVHGFLSSIRLVGKNKIFIVLRQGLNTLQGILSGEPKEQDSASLLEIKKLLSESYISIKGKVVQAKNLINSCTVQDKEIQISGVYIQSEADELPFQIKDTMWTHKERQENPNLPTVTLSKRLDSRSVDLRSSETRSIFRVYSTALQAFRNTLVKRGYLEIRSPKILGCASEGGAELFPVEYFKTKGALAQSPQLYKQLAIIGGLEKVFEIGPCFRAENSNTGRHLTEFTGVDLEKELRSENYMDLVKEIYQILREVIETIVSESQKDLEEIEKTTGESTSITIQEHPVIITFKKGIDILKGIGREVYYDQDIGTEDERMLGMEIKKLYNSDLFAIVEYPVSARPFYTSLLPTDKNFTQSFDFILRGEEILSGAERIHQKSLLIERVKEKGISPESVHSYIEAFSHGVPRHGGCGIGFERVVKLITQTKDIHKCSMFPRDPTRLFP